MAASSRGLAPIVLICPPRAVVEPGLSEILWDDLEGLGKQTAALFGPVWPVATSWEVGSHFP